MAKKPKDNKGPPKPVTPEERSKQVRDVLALIETGISENAACAEVGINRATFRAAALREKAGEDYARALERLAEDQIEKVEVAIQDMRDGRIDPQMARVEIDARKWFASKFLPKRYGEKVTQEISGPNGGPIEQRYAGYSDADLDAVIRDKAAELGWEIKPVTDK